MLSNCGAGKTLESPFDCKEIKPIHPKGNQPWIFIGRTDAEAEAPILWPPDANSLFTGKDPDAGKDWRWEEKGMTEDKMVGWHHWLNGHESEWAPGDSEGQEGLACCSPWGCKESDMTEWLNNNKSRKQVSGLGRVNYSWHLHQTRRRAELAAKCSPRRSLNSSGKPASSGASGEEMEGNFLAKQWSNIQAHHVHLVETTAHGPKKNPSPVDMRPFNP